MALTKKPLTKTQGISLVKVKPEVKGISLVKAGKAKVPTNPIALPGVRSAVDSEAARLKAEEKKRLAEEQRIEGEQQLAKHKQAVANNLHREHQQKKLERQRAKRLQEVTRWNLRALKIRTALLVVGIGCLALAFTCMAIATAVL